MKTQFKINTATQKAAVQKMEVAASIMRKCGITYPAWSEILFETGCRFVEKNIREKHIQICLLQNPQLGFWDWWLVVSLQDDEMLLSYSELKTLTGYIQEKERLLSLMEPATQFEYFLKSNQRINELEKV